jgi:chromosome segregation ATPase
MMTILVIILVLVLVAVLLSGKGLTLLSGFRDLFIENVAKTPEGAAAALAKAVDEATDQALAAKNTYEETNGKLIQQKEELADKINEFKIVESRCEALAKQGLEDQVAIYAQKRQEVMDEVESRKKTIVQLEPVVARAKEAFEMTETQLAEAKKKRKQILEEMKVNKTVRDAMRSVDSLTVNKDLAKLLAAVDEGHKESKEAAAGAQAVFEDRASTKLARAESSAKKAANDEYVKSLMAKYSGTDKK